jgi:hypothetical protein
MTWVESSSPSFHARHESTDADDAARVLERLEHAREALEGVFPRTVGDLTIVLHGSPTQLAIAQPYLPLLQRLTAPSGRRYLVGWFGAREIHVLAPRVLDRRASNVPGSRELLALAPAALYAATVVGANNPDLPPPFRPGSFTRYVRWAWLAQGAASYFAGQVAHVRPAVNRRLREGPTPSFPPALGDAPVLGGTVFDLLARQEGEQAAARLASRLHPDGAEAALVKAFHGRPLEAIEGAWRAHLSRLASAPV